MAGILGRQGRSWFIPGACVIAFPFCMFVFDNTEPLRHAMQNKQGGTKTFNGFAQVSAEKAFKTQIIQDVPCKNRNVFSLLFSYFLPCFGKRVGLGDPQRSLPTSTIL